MLNFVLCFLWRITTCLYFPWLCCLLIVAFILPTILYFHISPPYLSLVSMGGWTKTSWLWYVLQVGKSISSPPSCVPNDGSNAWTAVYQWYSCCCLMTPSYIWYDVQCHGQWLIVVYIIKLITHRRMSLHNVCGARSKRWAFDVGWFTNATMMAIIMHC